MDVILYIRLLLITLISSVTAQSEKACDCDRTHGVCQGDDGCLCNEGFTGLDCSKEICADGFCETGYRCLSDKECCSNSNCDPPQSLAAQLQGDESRFPPLAYIGIVLIVLMVGAMITAVLVAKRDNNNLRVEGSLAEKPDGIATFKPAADVTSTDMVTDITATWTRTESNAALEAPGLAVPYQSISEDTVDKMAWEEPEHKQSAAEEAIKELKAASHSVGSANSTTTHIKPPTAAGSAITQVKVPPSPPAPTGTAPAKTVAKPAANATTVKKKVVPAVKPKK